MRRIRREAEDIDAAFPKQRPAHDSVSPAGSTVPPDFNPVREREVAETRMKEVKRANA